MHGMLSAAVILAVFAVIALAGAASAVWLYRAADAPARRSQTARPGSAETPVASAAVGATAPAGADLGAAPWPSGLGHGGTALDDEEELGVVWEAPGEMTAYHPDPPRAPEQVYDLADWPDPDGAGGGLAGGPRAWPDMARSLYSRGWPVMDSEPAAAAGWTGPGEPQHPQSAGPDPDGPVSADPDDTGGPQDKDDGPPAGPRREGAQVYVLGEPRRTGP